MNVTLEILRRHLIQLGGKVSNGDLFHKYIERNGIILFICITADNNVMVQLSSVYTQSKTAISFPVEEEDVFFMYENWANKNKIITFYKKKEIQNLPIVFDDITLKLNKCENLKNKKKIEDVCTRAVKIILAGLCECISSLPVTMDYFGFYDYQYPQE